MEESRNRDLYLFGRCVLRCSPMGDLISIAAGRRRLIARRIFARWSRRFGEFFDEATRPCDLSDKTLARLIGGGEPAEVAIQELIVGVRQKGNFKTSSDNLHEKIANLDLMLFILDQLRFEAMRRLGWIDTYPTQGVPLINIVEQYQVRFACFRLSTPALSSNHPRYAEYSGILEADRASFVRRLIPEAIRLFCERFV